MFLVVVNESGNTIATADSYFALKEKLKLDYKDIIEAPNSDNPIKSGKYKGCKISKFFV